MMQYNKKWRQQEQLPHSLSLCSKEDEKKLGRNKEQSELLKYNLTQSHRENVTHHMRSMNDFLFA
jgi:hypothetical protein